MYNMHVLTYYSHRFWTAKTLEEWNYYSYICNVWSGPYANT
jgi:hypothetical protein